MEEAATWLGNLADWYTQYKDFLNEKTANPEPTGPTFWWTHDRVRKTYLQLERLARQRVLFTFLDQDLRNQGPVSRTTNHIEGYNAQIRRMLRVHRGMPAEHQYRAVGWKLWLDCASGASVDEVIRLDPVPIIALGSARKQGPVGLSIDEQRGVFSVGEGVVVRRGWGGRWG